MHFLTDEDDSLLRPLDSGIPPERPLSIDEEYVPAQLQKQVLEKEKRLSECLLWKVQEEYYSGCGLSAWDQVPYYPTSNAFICENYADLIVAFLLDYAPRLDLEAPLYILELAAGSGCFSFYLLRVLQRKLAHFERLRRLEVRYVMTDFAESIVDGWATREKLSPFLESGLLDFALFRPETDTRLTLRRSGIELEPGMLRNPVIAIANYFFDSIRHDMFRVTGHQLEEVRFSFHRELAEPLFSMPVTLDQLRLSRSYRPTQDSYYPDRRWNELLTHYRLMFDEASIIFPVGALACLRNLETLSGGRVVLLSSDKGFGHTEFMEGHWDQSYAAHDGAFSFMVNYHALQRYFRNQGGEMLTTADRTHVIQNAVGVLLPEPLALEHLTYRFEEKLVRKNDINDLYCVQDLLYPEALKVPDNVVRACLALIRMSFYDPIVFYGCADRIYDVIEGIDGYQRDAVVDMLEKVHQSSFLVRRKYKIPYWLGKIYYGLGQYDAALRLLFQALNENPDDPFTLYYIAASLEMERNYAAALSYYRQSIEADPGCQVTSRAIRRMEEKLGMSGAEADLEEELE